MRSIHLQVRALPRSLVLLMLVLASCVKDGGQTGDEDRPDSGATITFEQLGGSSHSNYQPAGSLRELADASDAVIVGRAERIERGRVFAVAPGDRIETVVMHVRVLDTLKGDAETTLYLEFIVGNVETLLPGALPDDRVLLFARPAPDESIVVDGTIEDAGSGLPAGETLRALTTPQGFAIETGNGGAAQIFEPSDTLLQDDSFDALIERVRDAADELPGPDASTNNSLPGPDASTNNGLPGPDASTASGERIVFTEAMVFSLPINSIRYGVSGYDAEHDLCISVIWYLDPITETRFCAVGDSLLPYVWVEQGGAAGCWDYAPNAELLAQRGCADFGELSDVTDDAIEVEVDVVSDLWSGTVAFTSP